MSGNFIVEADYPGGNMILDKIDGNEVFLHQDMRDSDGVWFYWSFRVRNGGGKKLHFRFTHSRCLTAKGAAVTVDNHQSYHYSSEIDNDYLGFSYEIPVDCNEAYFYQAIPYRQQEWERFVASLGDCSYASSKILCKSRRGRDVEQLILGNSKGRFNMVLTARHHCCEALANYVLEGMLERFLRDDEIGKFMRENVFMTVIPFMDKDGCVDGDQGKNRLPHDHNRDYGAELYPEVKYLKKFVADNMSGKVLLSLDFHCPWLYDGACESIYLVGQGVPRISAEQIKLARLIEECNRGALPFYASEFYPYGYGWNQTEVGLSCAGYFSSLPQTQLATTLEFTYASCHGLSTSVFGARIFGEYYGDAVYKYLRTLC